MAEQKQELKAGHPPAGSLLVHIICMYVWQFPLAVKAGGMRVVTKHKHDDADADAYDQKYVDALPEPM